VLKNKLNSWMVVMVCVLFLAGCITTTNLLRPGNYGKEIVPHDKTSLKAVWAVDDKGKLKVSMKLRLKGSLRVDIPDFVEVALVDRSGAVLSAQKVAYYPRTLTGRKLNKEAKFSTWFAEMPPGGTSIRVRNVN
jgi:hypothetical protein